MEVITRKCSYCGSVEGKIRPIGNYVVKLKALHMDGKSYLACQSCYLNKKTEMNKTNEKDIALKKKLIERLKNIFVFTTTILYIVEFSV